MKLKYDFYSTTNQWIIDALIAGVAFVVAYQLRFEWHVPPSGTYQIWLLLPAVMFGRVLVSSLLGIYRHIWRYISLNDALVVSRSHLAFSSILLILRLGMPDRWAILRVPLSVIVMDFLLSLLGSLGARTLRRVLYQRQSDNALEGAIKRMLLVGAGRAGIMVAKELVARPEVKLVGFLDDDPKKIGSVISGVRVLGPLDALPSVVKRHDVEEVIICIPRAPRAALKRLWALSDHLSVQVKIVPTLEEVLQGQVNIAAFRDVQMADLLGRESVELPAIDPGAAEAYRGKRILITGAGGSIGSELARQLIQFSPEQLVLLDKDENGLHDIYVRLGNSTGACGVHAVVADIRFPERLRAVFSCFRPEVIFHAAAHKHVPLMEMNPCEAILNNVVGTRNLVELSQTFGVARFIFISTDKAVKPVSIMGASKRVCEMIVQARGANGQTRFACVRFGNVVGSRGSVVPLFQRQIARGGPITVTHPDVQRFLMTIPEAVRLVIQAGGLASSGETFILDMGDPVPIMDLARDLIELSGLQPGRDIQIEMTQLRPGEKLIEELIDSTTEQLASTCYEKIRVVRGRVFNATVFASKLRALEQAARRESPQDVHRTLRELNIGFEPAFNGQIKSEELKSNGRGSERSRTAAAVPEG